MTCELTFKLQWQSLFRNDRAVIIIMIIVVVVILCHLSLVLNQSYLLCLSSICAFIVNPVWPRPRSIRPRPHSTWPRPRPWPRTLLASLTSLSRTPSVVNRLQNEWPRIWPWSSGSLIYVKIGFRPTKACRALTFALARLSCHLLELNRTAQLTLNE